MLCVSFSVSPFEKWSLICMPAVVLLIVLKNQKPVKVTALEFGLQILIHSLFGFLTYFCSIHYHYWSVLYISLLLYAWYWTGTGELEMQTGLHYNFSGVWLIVTNLNFLPPTLTGNDQSINACNFDKTTQSAVKSNW